MSQGQWKVVRNGDLGENVGQLLDPGDGPKACRVYERGKKGKGRLVIVSMS